MDVSTPLDQTDTITSFMNAFCKAGAEAVRCYVDISHSDPLDPPYMPEYFVSSYILQHLGSRWVMTLETNLNHIMCLNQSIPAKNSKRRVDMVIFDPITNAKSTILALAEFKNGKLDYETIPSKDSDRDKMLRLFSLIDTCPYGIVCGWIDQRWLDYHQPRLPDTLFTDVVPGSFRDKNTYLFGALLMKNHNFHTRID